MNKNGSYLAYDRKAISLKSSEEISSMYGSGYVLTRIGPGIMEQTKSLRIDLRRFELTSENRRILRKTEDLELDIVKLPFEKSKYDWSIQKLAKDFYTSKFGDKTFSANKVRELLTTNHNFNVLIRYRVQGVRKESNKLEIPNIGYCICYESEEILHYCYPFYDLSVDFKNLGMGMMIKAVLWAKDKDKKYVYLGSLSRPTDKYKLQFEGLEAWKENKGWSTINIRK
jgi:arginyl-tRNA--protein-N-Asp/Glu arginylyltransferase